MMIVHIIAPINEMDDRAMALTLLVGLFLCDWGFHFDSVLRIMNLE